jgi:hypothetical protein
MSLRYTMHVDRGVFLARWAEHNVDVAVKFTHMPYCVAAHAALAAHGAAPRLYLCGTLAALPRMYVVVMEWIDGRPASTPAHCDAVRAALINVLHPRGLV